MTFAITPQNFNWLLFAGISSVVVAGFGINRIYERRRREGFERYALERGLRFELERPGEEQRHTATCPVFSKGHSRRWRYTLTGTRNGVPFTSFEYRFTVGSGKDSSTQYIGAMLWTLEGGRLPQFMLTPEGLFDRISSHFGGQDFDFQDSPEFSRQYRLRGPDEPAVRALFTAVIRHAFGGEPGHNVSGAGNELMWWRGGRLPLGDELDQFMANGERLRRLFMTE